MRKVVVLHLSSFPETTINLKSKLSMLQSKFLPGFLVSVPKCLSAGVISQVFPLHDQEALHKLRQTWVRSFTKTQPLGESLLFDKNIKTTPNYFSYMKKTKLSINILSCLDI